MSIASEAPVALAARPGFIGTGEVARRMGVCVSTVERMMAAGQMPAPRKIGRVNRWCLEEINRWLDRPKPDGRLMTAKEWEPVRAAMAKARKN